jgi:hypothetical protein
MLLAPDAATEALLLTSILFAPEAAAKDDRPPLGLGLPGRYSSREPLPPLSLLGDDPLELLGPLGAGGDEGRERSKDS